jgi:hypothetical protein
VRTNAARPPKSIRSRINPLRCEARSDGVRTKENIDDQDGSGGDVQVEDQMGATGREDNEFHGDWTGVIHEQEESVVGGGTGALGPNVTGRSILRIKSMDIRKHEEEYVQGPNVTGRSILRIKSMDIRKHEEEYVLVYLTLDLKREKRRIMKVSVRWWNQSRVLTVERLLRRASKHG